MVSSSELAVVYAALILHDDEVAITADKLKAICAAAKVQVDAIWPELFAKALAKSDVGSLLNNIGSASSAPAAASAAAPAAAAAAPAAAAKKEEKKEESEEEADMGFGLFD